MVRTIFCLKNAHRNPILRRLKTAFLFIGMPVGGAEDFSLGVHRFLSPEVSSRFVCVRSLDLLGEEAKAQGLPVDLVEVFPTKRISLLGIWRLSRWLMREGIEIVHSQTYHAHLFGIAAARLAGIPVVIHQQKTLGRLSWRKEFLFGWCLRRSKKIITLSERTRSEIARRYSIPIDRIAVVPNAIDETVFTPDSNKQAVRRKLGLPEDARLFGTVASMHAVKNHRAILEALTLVSPEIQSVFVGDGVERANLERIAREKVVSERVFFAGRQRPVAPWFQAMDVFLLPSIWEGQPLALLQAISCGLPVLASRIEGNTAVLGDNHPGLFDPGDFKALAAMMEDAASNPDRYLARGDAVSTCREAAEKLKKIYADVR
jgi:glycosyltransferase involved in cell wall biosynthesis